MAAKKPRDHAAYIAAAEPFARPILRKARALWREAAPKTTAVMKWGSPFFEGEGLVFGMSSFKKHVSLVLWNSRGVPGAEKHFPADKRMPSGTLKVTHGDEMPSDATMLKIFKAAARADAEGAAPEMKKAARLVTPKDFSAAMKKNAKAAATYKGFSTSRKREYVEWIEEAKREATREKRIATAVEWLSEGKEKNWRYRDC